MSISKKIARKLVCLFKLYILGYYWRIPPGPYCYYGSRDPKDGNFKKCPYWRKVPGAPYQEDGGCTFLNTTDEKSEHIGLLFDRVKECRVKEDDLDGRD
jgi:hypothetical protein